MAITVKELPTSRDLQVTPQRHTATLEYWAQADDPETDAGDIKDAVANASPLTYLRLRKTRISSIPLGGGFWHVSVEYESPEAARFGNGSGVGGGGGGGGEKPPAGAGENFALDDQLKGELAFNTIGSTEHITQALDTVNQALAPGVAGPVWTGKAIGVSKSGVAGTDIASSKLEWVVTREVDFVTMRYLHKLAKCTGCTNTDLWNTWESFRVLFLGAEGRAQGALGEIPKWTITYHFLIGNHEKDIVIGGDSPASTITVPVKLAHDYLWVGYRDDKHDTAGVILQVPKFANVERVYHSRPFAFYLEF